MNRFFSFLILFFIVFHADAQQILRLQVLDPSNESLPYLTVSITNSDTSQILINTQTDIEGKAQLTVPQFPVNLKISALGYEPYSRKIEKLPSFTLIVQLNQKINSLTEIVVTGVGRPTKLDEAVSIYKIISSADIQSQGAVNLQDALQNQLGISIAQDAMTGGKVKMQGMSGDNVKILIDGLPVNGREGQNIDLSTLNLNNIEKIEIAQGPMSVMYGADALSGVINLITKSNDEIFSIGANAFYETTGKYNVGADIAKRMNNHDLFVSGGRNFFQGWDPENMEKRNPLWRPKEQYLANLKYNYRFSNDASITFGMDYLNDLLIIKGDPENYSYYNRHVRDDYFETQRWMNRLQAKWKTGDHGYWESNNSYSLYKRARTSYFTDLSTIKRNLSSYDGDQSETTFNDFTLRTTYNNKAGILSYTFGYDVNLEYSSAAEKIQGGEKFIGDYALLLVTDFDLSDKLKIQPALRASINTEYRTPLIPSFSILYKPAKKFQIRGSYARGFRAPTLKEMYLDFKDSNHDIFGNDSLSSEDGHHLQFSTGYTLYQKGNNYNNITLSGYYNDVRNQITLAQSGGVITPGTPVPYTYVNIGYFKNVQLQLITQNQYKEFFVSMGGSYNRSIKTVTNAAYDYWEANANFRYRFEKAKSSISLFYKYTGPAPLMVTDVTGGFAIEKGVVSHEYHNLDASVEKRFLKDRVHLVLGVRNLFNNTIIGITGTSTNPLANSPHGSSDGNTNLSTGRSIFTSLRIRL